MYDFYRMSTDQYVGKYGQGVSGRQATLMLAAHNFSVILENIRFQRRKLNNTNLIASAGDDYNPFNYQKSVAGGDLTLVSLLAHYMEGSGDEYFLNEDSFEDLVIEMYQKGRLNPEGAGLINSASGLSGLWKLDFSAYGTKYENAVGSGTLYFNKSGIVGYSDKWNFSHCEVLSTSQHVDEGMKHHCNARMHQNKVMMPANKGMRPQRKAKIHRY